MNPNYIKAMEKKRALFYLAVKTMAADIDEPFIFPNHQKVMDYMHELAIIDDAIGWTV